MSNPWQSTENSSKRKHMKSDGRTNSLENKLSLLKQKRSNLVSNLNVLSATSKKPTRKQQRTGISSKRLANATRATNNVDESNGHIPKQDNPVPTKTLSDTATERELLEAMEARLAALERARNNSPKSKSAASPHRQQPMSPQQKSPIVQSAASPRLRTTHSPVSLTLKSHSPHRMLSSSTSPKIKPPSPVRQGNEASRLLAVLAAENEAKIKAAEAAEAEKRAKTIQVAHEQERIEAEAARQKQLDEQIAAERERQAAARALEAARIEQQRMEAEKEQQRIEAERIRVAEENEARRVAAAAEAKKKAEAIRAKRKAEAAAAVQRKKEEEEARRRAQQEAEERAKQEAEERAKQEAEERAQQAALMELAAEQERLREEEERVRKQREKEERMARKIREATEAAEQKQLALEAEQRELERREAEAAALRQRIQEQQEREAREAAEAAALAKRREKAEKQRKLLQKKREEQKRKKAEREQREAEARAKRQAEKEAAAARAKAEAEAERVRQAQEEEALKQVEEQRRLAEQEEALRRQRIQEEQEAAAERAAVQARLDAMEATAAAKARAWEEERIRKEQEEEERIAAASAAKRTQTVAQERKERQRRAAEEALAQKRAFFGEQDVVSDEPMSSEDDNDDDPVVMSVGPMQQNGGGMLSDASSIEDLDDEEALATGYGAAEEERVLQVQQQELHDLLKRTAAKRQLLTVVSEPEDDDDDDNSNNVTSPIRQQYKPEEEHNETDEEEEEAKRRLVAKVERQRRDIAQQKREAAKAEQLKADAAARAAEKKAAERAEQAQELAAKVARQRKAALQAKRRAKAAREAEEQENQRRIQEQKEARRLALEVKAKRRQEREAAAKIQQQQQDAAEREAQRLHEERMQTTPQKPSVHVPLEVFHPSPSRISPLKSPVMKNNLFHESVATGAVHDNDDDDDAGAAADVDHKKKMGKPLSSREQLIFEQTRRHEMERQLQEEKMMTAFLAKENALIAEQERRERDGTWATRTQELPIGFDDDDDDSDDGDEMPMTREYVDRLEDTMRDPLSDDDATDPFDDTVDEAELDNHALAWGRNNAKTDVLESLDDAMWDRILAEQQTIEPAMEMNSPKKKTKSPPLDVPLAVNKIIAVLSPRKSKPTTMAAIEKKPTESKIAPVLVQAATNNTDLSNTLRFNDVALHNSRQLDFYNQTPTPRVSKRVIKNSEELTPPYRRGIEVKVDAPTSSGKKKKMKLPAALAERLTNKTRIPKAVDVIQAQEKKKRLSERARERARIRAAEKEAAEALKREEAAKEARREERKQEKLREKAAAYEKRQRELMRARRAKAKKKEDEQRAYSEQLMQYVQDKSYGELHTPQVADNNNKKKPKKKKSALSNNELQQLLVQPADDQEADETALVAEFEREERRAAAANDDNKYSVEDSLNMKELELQLMGLNDKLLSSARGVKPKPSLKPTTTATTTATMKNNMKRPPGNRIRSGRSKKKKTNALILANAVSHVLLAGEINVEQRNKVLAALKGSNAEHFVLSFTKRGGILVFRAVYAYNALHGVGRKIYGDGPDEFHDTAVRGYYKYDSASKAFTLLNLQKFSPTVDGVWLNKPTDAKKRAIAPSSTQKITIARRSNKKKLKNALIYVCLAGEINARTRTAALRELTAAPGDQFLLLLVKHGGNVQFKAIYVWDAERAVALRIFGDGPHEVDELDMRAFYKYDSAGKMFVVQQELSKFSPTVDAFLLNYRF